MPLALIVLLARNLIEALDVPAFLTGPEGELLFFNEAAGDLVGRRFEEVGQRPLHMWAPMSALDEGGRRLPTERLPLAQALRQGIPATGRFAIHTDDDRMLEFYATAVPLRDEQDSHGAVVLFWPKPGRGAAQVAARRSSSHAHDS